MRRAHSAIAAIIATALLVVPAAEASANPVFEFDYRSSSSVTSVSPEVIVKADTYYLFTTGMGGIGVYTSSDGEAWSQVSGANTPRGAASDASVIEMADGSYRMYYAERVGTGNQPCSGKQLRYATSADLTSWTVQPGVLLADLGCGVPDVVRDGSSFYLYYVRGGPGVAHGIYVATSPNGIDWTPNPDIRTPEDLVDPSVVKLADGTWLMMTSDMPSGKTSGPFFQKLWVGTSTDAISWDFGIPDGAEAVYAPAGINAFDPNLNLMPDGTLKTWFARGASAEVATVAYGILTEDAPAPAPVPPAKPTLTFAKSKATVSWQFPVGAATPDGFIIERKSGSAWVQVADVGADKRTFVTTVVSLGGKAGKKVTVRVVAILGDQRAESPSAAARVPKR